ncbi:MAG: Mut7-C ubiquitin/RNAse domain-containing protein [Anaerolineae bacterium]|nr:Mut7-C ubiquitin/RNAse domain-containing protein [Anaerolineae bacterium]
MNPTANRASFTFDGALNFFLPRAQQYQRIEHVFEWRASIKDMIESLGVPHPEIELIVVNGAAVDFNHIVEPGDVVIAYPPEHGVAVTALPLRPPYPGRPAFILDQHLGRLAAYLRMLGFDTLYRNDYHDEELARVSHDEQRILLTRDIGLLKRSLVIYGYYVRETNRQRQLAEITRRYHLTDAVQPFRHCMKCNGLLIWVAKEAVADQLPDGTARYYDEFHRCTSCEQVYWKGPHYQRMQTLIDQVINGR